VEFEEAWEKRDNVLELSKKKDILYVLKILNHIIKYILVILIPLIYLIYFSLIVSMWYLITHI
jgi:hypothetical protein